MNRMTKRELRFVLGLSQDAQLATYFGISHSAVCQWAEDAAVPLLRQLEAERREPTKFQRPGSECPLACDSARAA